MRVGDPDVRTNIKPSKGWSDCIQNLPSLCDAGLYQRTLGQHRRAARAGTAMNPEFFNRTKILLLFI